MRTRSAVLIGTVAAMAGGLAGCPSSSCPLETPQVSGTPGTCTELAGQPVSYPLRLCPTCNQTGVTCAPNLSAVGAGSGPIYLDVKAEACNDSTSCGGAGCQLNQATCEFTAPSTPGTYQIIVIDGATGQPVPGAQLQVVASGPTSCALATASL